jgi:YD repeat-containing protein
MKFVYALLILGALCVSQVMAGVNLKNGNFYISYTDIVVPGGDKSLKVVRTYNSKSTEIGWFGFGWGSDFESFLKVSADGSIVIHENGAGARTRFVPKQAIDTTAAAKKIVNIMRKQSSLTETVAKDLVDKLSKNEELRHAYARKFKVEASLPSGTILHSNDRGIQTVAVTKEGYRRDYSDGKKDYFDKTGKLVQIKDKNGYYIKLDYKGDNVASIKDSNAKQLFFSWYAGGKPRVKAIWSAGDKKANYKYDNDDLTESTDVAGNTYKYTYDSNHNMTSVIYTDGSKMQVGYEKKTQFVNSITKRNGSATTYKYESNPKNPNFHYWTFVTKNDINGKPVTNKYEYEIKTKPDGSQYTYRIETMINSVKTETVYSECCSLPLKIQRGNQITNFEYDGGLLTKKTSSSGEFVKLEYDQKHKKISKVTNNKGWTEFHYDGKGNLQKAFNSGRKAVLLIYDRKGRITKMVDDDRKEKKKRVLSFKYNSLGKPIEIALDKAGKINVEYDNYGEIKKVESKAGHKMALQVTQAFQSLLSIVKPAGVNLSL